MDMAAPAPAKPGTIGLKATSHGAAGTGTVESIRFSEDHAGAARITVRYGDKPKHDKRGMTVGPWPETSDLVIPAKTAKQLHVGMKVRVSIVPLGRHAAEYEGD